MSKEEKLRRATDELRQRVADLERDIQALGQAAKAAAQEKLDDVREHVAASCDERREKLHDFERSIERSLTEKPLKSLLVAVGLGFLMGAFWTRR